MPAPMTPQRPMMPPGAMGGMPPQRPQMPPQMPPQAQRPIAPPGLAQASGLGGMPPPGQQMRIPQAMPAPLGGQSMNIPTDPNMGMQFAMPQAQQMTPQLMQQAQATALRGM